MATVHTFVEAREAMAGQLERVGCADLPLAGGDQACRRGADESCRSGHVVRRKSHRWHDARARERVAAGGHGARDIPAGAREYAHRSGDRAPGGIVTFIGEDDREGPQSHSAGDTSSKECRSSSIHSMRSPPEPRRAAEGAGSDPVIEAYKRDVDRTLLRQNLRKTVPERVAALIELQRLASEAHSALRRSRDGNA